MDKDQAIKVAESLQAQERARLEEDRQRKARPPSFLFAVSGLRALPRSEQEELYTQAKWRTVKNWRFLALAAAILAGEIGLVWWAFQNPTFLLLIAYLVIPGGMLMSLVAIPFVRAELHSLLRVRHDAT